MPETLTATLRKVRLRLQLLVIARALAIGGAAFGAAMMIVGLKADAIGVIEGLVVGVVAAAIVIVSQWRINTGLGRADD